MYVVSVCSIRLLLFRNKAGVNHYHSYPMNDWEVLFTNSKYFLGLKLYQFSHEKAINSQYIQKVTIKRY